MLTVISWRDCFYPLDKLLRRRLVLFIRDPNALSKIGFYTVPYFFEDGYENHVYSSYNSTESMANMEELLGLFEEHTCVKFKKLTTDEEKASYDYKLEIIWDGVNPAMSYIGKQRIF